MRHCNVTVAPMHLFGDVTMLLSSTPPQHANTTNLSLARPVIFVKRARSRGINQTKRLN